MSKNEAPSLKDIKDTKQAIADGEEVPMHRIRFLIIDPNQFVAMFTKGLVLTKRFRIIEGVPADAEVIRMTVDHVRGGIILVVSSEEYEEIPINKMPEVQYVKIDLGNPKATKKGAKH